MRDNPRDCGDPQRQARALEWMAAERDAIAGRLTNFSIRYRGHWFYRDGEVPAHRPCDCGATLRVDRLDLVAEHLRLCPAAAEWVAAERDGIAGRLANFSFRYHGHWFYREHEVPEYGPCDCGATLRVDRLDRVAEHLRQCPAPP